MNKFLAIIATTIALSTSVVAAESGYEFYSNQSQNWYIGGYSGDSTTNPACYTEFSFQDGSSFQLVKDLKDGEVYIFFRNMQWNIIDDPGQYSLRMNLTTSGGNINPASGEYYFQLINKNTVSINQLNADEFIPGFMNSAEIGLIMPGDIENAYIPLDGSSRATELLADCIDKSEQVKLYNSNSTLDVVPKINS